MSVCHKSSLLIAYAARSSSNSPFNMKISRAWPAAILRHVSLSNLRAVLPGGGAKGSGGIRPVLPAARHSSSQCARRALDAAREGDQRGHELSNQHPAQVHRVEKKMPRIGEKRGKLERQNKCQGIEGGRVEICKLESAFRKAGARHQRA